MTALELLLTEIFGEKFGKMRTSLQQRCVSSVAGFCCAYKTTLVYSVCIKKKNAAGVVKTLVIRTFV